MDHVKSHQMWEIGREINPVHRVFWIDTAFFVGLILCATWQVFEYATSKAHAANKGYLFTGAHHLWRVGIQCVLALVLLITEWVLPGGNFMHYVLCFAILSDAMLLYIHVEKSQIPFLFPLLEAFLTCLLAFGVSDKGRMTTPMLLMIASFRLAAALWPLSQDEDAFKIVSATLMASLAWHWFPIMEAFDVFNAAQAQMPHQPVAQYNNAVDFVFLSNIILGHLSVLGLLWRIFPQVFRNEMAFELEQKNMQGP
jgi:hypothetical protein